MSVHGGGGRNSGCKRGVNSVILCFSLYLFVMELAVVGVLSVVVVTVVVIAQVVVLTVVTAVLMLVVVVEW